MLSLLHCLLPIDKYRGLRYNEDNHFFSGADSPIQLGSKAWSKARGAFLILKAYNYNKKSFKSLMYKKVYYINHVNNNVNY